MQKNRVVIFLKNLDFFRLWNIIVIIERDEQQQLLWFSSCFFESIMCSEASFFSKKEKSLFNNFFCANIINLPEDYHDHHQIDNCIKERKDIKMLQIFFTTFIYSLSVEIDWFCFTHCVLELRKKNWNSDSINRGGRGEEENSQQPELFLEKFFSLNTEWKLAAISGWMKNNFEKGVELSSK